MIQHNHDLEILKQMAMADGILTENEKEQFLETLDLLYRRSKQESRAGFPHVLNRVKGL